MNILRQQLNKARIQYVNSKRTSAAWNRVKPSDKREEQIKHMGQGLWLTKTQKAKRRLLRACERVSCNMETVSFLKKQAY